MIRRVFVTGTGRCGTKTFAAACRHFTNWKVAHESTNGLRAPSDLDFPEGHIEVNPHLSWLLGPLMERYGRGEDVLYVHLVRREAEVVRSWDRRGRTGGPGRWTPLACRVDATRLNQTQWEYVSKLCWQSITHTVDTALAPCAASTTLRLEDLTEGTEEDRRKVWDAFARRIGATGDMDGAFGEWSVKHNRSR